MLSMFFFSSRRRHTRLQGDWSSDVCSSDLEWWPVYKTNVYTDITILNTAELDKTKVNLDQFEKIGRASCRERV